MAVISFVVSLLIYEGIVDAYGSFQQKLLQQQRQQLYAALIPSFLWLFVLRLVGLNLEAFRRFPLNLFDVELPNLWPLPSSLEFGCDLVLAAGGVIVLYFLLKQPTLFLSPEINDYASLRSWGAISSLLGSASLVLSTIPSLISLVALLFFVISARSIRQNRNGYRDFGKPTLVVGDNVKVSLIVARVIGATVVGSSVNSRITIQLQMKPEQAQSFQVRDELTVRATVEQINVFSIAQAVMVYLKDVRVV